MNSQLLKVLLVDDEVLVRDLLKKCVDWSSLGVTIAGEASGAVEALVMVDELLPDLIFTDICMPAIDGIELCELILAKHPWIKVVIITGYEDFAYAKRSINAGVTDYVLKPINDEEIVKITLKIKAKIAAERDRNFEYERLKKQLAESLPYLREKFLNELLLFPLNSEEITRKIAYYDIPIQTGFFQVIVIEISEESNQNNEEERLILQMRSYDIVRENLKQYQSVTVFIDNNQRLVIINCNAQMDVNMLCETVNFSLLNQLSCVFYIGVGNSGSGYNQLRTSYREACAALKYKILTEKNEIIFYQDFGNHVEETWCFSNEQMDMFNFYLKAGMEEQALQLLKQFFKEFSLNRNFSVDLIRMAGLKIVMAVLNTVHDLRLEPTKIFGLDHSPYDQVFGIDNLPKLERYLIDLTRKAAGCVNEQQHKKTNKVIQEVQEYLQQNYANDDLSQTTVAKQFYINPSYLSRIFKQAINQTFVEYLTQIRMEKAKQFLKETDLKAYQVAELIGIGDPHYFGICFKKYTGMSVNEYKKAHSF